MLLKPMKAALLTNNAAIITTGVTVCFNVIGIIDSD